MNDEARGYSDRNMQDYEEDHDVPLEVVSIGCMGRAGHQELTFPTAGRPVLIYVSTRKGDLYYCADHAHEAKI